MDVFQNPINHATAAASILVQSAQLSDFRPNEKSAKSLASVHGDFVEKVSTFIGFKRMNMFEEAIPLKNHATVEEFEQAIHDKLLEATLNGKIASKFARLLPFHQEDESLRNWILSLVVLDKLQGGDIVRIQLARVKLSIAFDQTYTGTKPTFHSSTRQSL
ncbi:hypothetical protein BGZ92_000489 [Podila epicladia]|nr:hypothetical protein BGZ92_000489 [Podila epicladia]